jgi:macrolide transport system ATP-binding/permease protein
MRWIRSICRRLRSVVSKESSNAALSEELQFHLARTVEENMAAGMPEREAVTAAQASFGSWTGTTEQCYQARGTAWIDDFLQDFRYGLRTLTKHRSFSVISILTLALGIGACTAIFSVFDAVLLRSLPYGSPKQLVYLYTPSAQLLRMGIPAEVFNPSFADFFDLKKQSHAVEEMTLFQETSFNLAADGRTERVGAARIDADFFRTLQSQPQVGRAISAGDQQQGNDRVAIISHALWEQMFAGTRNILDRTVRLDGDRYWVIGVMPLGARRIDSPAVDVPGFLRGLRSCSSEAWSKGA